VTIVQFVGSASLFWFFCVFPDGSLVPSWTRWLVVAWVAWWQRNHITSIFDKLQLTDRAEAIVRAREAGLT
jgi:hypothetical protein